MDHIIAKSIFSRAEGFIRRGGFAWTCNPYKGCTYGCRYCYAMFLQQNDRPVEDWGKWVEAKINAIELAQKEGRKLQDQAAFMASVTDPYQPVERSLGLTRGILEALVPYQPRLVIQTRSPLVMHDIDVLSQFRAVRINMSIPTDCEAIRQKFEPKAPPLERRWEALAEVKASGLPVGICVTPMLPLKNPEAFAARLEAFGPDVLVAQDFHDRHNGFGANTADIAWELLDECGWTKDDYRRCFEMLSRGLHVYEGEAGFFPPEPALTPEGASAAQSEETSTSENRLVIGFAGGNAVKKPQKCLDDAIVLTTYSQLDEYMVAFADGHLRLVILIGPPGVQKSWRVREVVGPDACLIEGHVTPLGMYCQLYKHCDQFVVIDDVDELYAHPTAVRLLKCLCQTEPVKRIAWTSMFTAMGQAGIPEEFTTTSAVIIIANEWRTLSENVGALQDRGHVLFFEPTPLEVHRRVADWFSEQEIFDFIGAHLHLIARPSMRYYVRALELKNASLNWREALLNQWLPTQSLRIAAQVLADPAYKTEEARVQAFIVQGGGCRATYFNHKKNLQPPQPVPQIILKHRQLPLVPRVNGELLDQLRRRGDPPFQKPLDF